MSARIIEKFMGEIASSEVLPFEREIPEKIQKKIDEYFGNRWNAS